MDILLLDKIKSSHSAGTGIMPMNSNLSQRPFSYQIYKPLAEANGNVKPTAM